MDKREMVQELLKSLGLDIPVVGDTIILNQTPDYPRGDRFILMDFQDALPGWAQVLPELTFRNMERSGRATSASGKWAYLPQLKEGYDQMEALAADPAAVAEAFQSLVASTFSGDTEEPK